VRFFALWHCLEAGAIWMSDVESLRDYGSIGHVRFTILVPRLLRVPFGRGEYVESRVQLPGCRGVEPRVFSREVFFSLVYGALTPSIHNIYI